MKKRVKEILIAIIFLAFSILAFMQVSYKDENYYSGEIATSSLMSENENIALNKAASSLDFFQDFYASNAVDGKTSTSWNSGTKENSVLVIDLMQDYSVYGLKIYCEGKNGGTSGEIKFYDSNMKVVLVKRYASCENLEPFENSFNSIENIRTISIESISNGDWNHINEIEVYGNKKCNPETCAELGKQCGEWTETRCGMKIFCNSCANDEICSGGVCIKNDYTNLNYYSAPEQVLLNQNFEIKCDFGANLSCISAKHGGKKCGFSGFEGSVAVFNCIAENSGIIENNCDLVYSYGQKGCSKSRINKIQSTKVINVNSSCISNCSGKSCGDDDGCGFKCNLACKSDDKCKIGSCMNSGCIYTWKQCPENQICESLTGNCINRTESSLQISNYDCVDEKTYAMNKKCPNGCLNKKCITNPYEAKIQTLVFAGLYPKISIERGIKELNLYSEKLSDYINGVAICCNIQSNDKELIDKYHNKGYMVMTHVINQEDAIQAAEDRIDIILFDEIKMFSGINNRPLAFSGQDFNLIKQKIKDINPNAMVGIVEANAEDYEYWINGRANPDIIGLENYLDKWGNSKYLGYEEFERKVAREFPNAKIQAWINNANQIDEFFGKVDSIVLFAVDRDRLGHIEYNWPELRLNEIKERLSKINGDYFIEEETCVSDCSERTCGNDGCGDMCGECERGKECGGGTCMEIPCTTFQKILNFFGIRKCY